VMIGNWCLDGSYSLKTDAATAAVQTATLTKLIGPELTNPEWLKSKKYDPADAAVPEASKKVTFNQDGSFNVPAFIVTTVPASPVTGG
jgi:hypothetical protein